jgi:two-component system CheB/CheR fusion protein
MLAQRAPDDPIRVWSAGCASGQEAYTLAMLLAEALGPEELRQRVKIYATDVDENALTKARAASYDAKAVEPVPSDLL